MATMKDKRLEVRVSGHQKELIEQAAAIEGRNLSEFATIALTERATEVIRREHELQMEAETFDRFSALLDEPARTIDGLTDLLRRPSVFID
ncbi:DUF1778 domain-containing protein [Leifsonia sp. F6_8S_P_1B]|uniref:DUF1778 domain-containing protein n=1 Tax=Leifsonia williamsii TaxID=3035919 RepID=A0ABT8K664_9MICO|nr:DUF1778 domain-containing protein [Leifsonia williamsii]MDN4612948.1 DUF1778 domain-containing protein [Leifsonia williamsii]